MRPTLKCLESNFPGARRECICCDDALDEREGLMHIDVLLSCQLVAHTIATVHAFNSCSSRPDVCQWITCYKPSTTLTHIRACKLKLCLVMRSTMHPWPGNWMATIQSAGGTQHIYKLQYRKSILHQSTERLPVDNML